MILSPSAQSSLRRLINLLPPLSGEQPSLEARPTFGGSIPGPFHCFIAFFDELRTEGNQLLKVLAVG